MNGTTLAGLSNAQLRFAGGAVLGLVIGGLALDGGEWAAIALAALFAPLAGIPGSAWYARRGRVVRALLGLPTGFVIGYVVVIIGWMIFGTDRPSSSGGDAMGAFFILAPLGGFVMAIVGAIWLGRRRIPALPVAAG